MRIRVHKRGSCFFLSYLSRSLADRWGTTADVTTTCLHSIVPGFFFGVESYQWLKNWHSRATLPGAWRDRVSAGTGQPGVSLLWVGEVESWICIFYLSVAARKIVCADPSLRYTSMLLGRCATNKQTNPRGFQLPVVWYSIQGQSTDPTDGFKYLRTISYTGFFLLHFKPRDRGRGRRNAFKTCLPSVYPAGFVTLTCRIPGKRVV